MGDAAGYAPVSDHKSALTECGLSCPLKHNLRTTFDCHMGNESKSEILMSLTSTQLECNNTVI